MRVLGFLVAGLLLILGVVGLLAPNRLLETAQFTTTPTGVYVTAGIRLAIGVSLFLVAPQSRFPKILRVLGAFVFIGGIATFFIGSVGARAIASSTASYGTIVPRLFGVVALATGSFLAYAMSDKRFDETR
jgi:hypothetical protein